VAERVVDPFVSGIHAGDPHALSMAGTFPSLLRGEREHGSLLRWGPARLASILGPRVRTGVDVREIGRCRGGSPSRS
jgi:protoporphyrinogen oxidase